jgi:hypothetical protein
VVTGFGNARWALDTLMHGQDFSYFLLFTNTYASA